MTERTENDAIIEQARQAAGADILATVSGDDIAVLTTLDGSVKLIDLASDEYVRRMDRPRRKVGTTTVKDVASFAQFYAKHADENTETFVDLDAGVITAVLNANEPDAPRWGDHWLQLRLTSTEQWKTWMRHNRQPLPQLAFAEHIEDNLPDIATEPVTAADMLEIAQTFQAKTSVSYSSGTRLASGDISVHYEETTDASGGAKGKIAIPKAFALGLAPFDDVDPYRITVRLRYRIQGNKLHLIYVMDRPEDVVRDAVKTVVGKVEEACSIKVMRGAPA